MLTDFDDIRHDIVELFQQNVHKLSIILLL